MNSDTATIDTSLFPQEPIHRYLRPLSRFLHVEAASGIVLLICATGALILANTPVGDAYLAFWNLHVGFSIGGFELDHSFKHWINDGLMAIFFFVIGLEVKRELVIGELRDVRSASLPVASAIGGMVLPAGFFLAMQAGEPGQSGWGIPMATDIAFVVGCMAVLGSRVPAGLRIMLLSLAIVDDIGAILVIAIGYTENLSLSWLALGVIGIGIVLILQRLGVRSMGMYTLIGVVIWLGFHESGIHATIAGVILGLLTPARPYLEHSVSGELIRRASEMIHGGRWSTDPHRAEHITQLRFVTLSTVSPLEYLIYLLHPWVAFVIMPLFALANAGVAVEIADLFSPVALAIILGLVLGKPIGIVLMSWLAVVSGLSRMPEGVSWRHVLGGGFLAGIGFTMALFITGLAFDDAALVRPAKVGVLVGSFISAVIGIAILLPVPHRQHERIDERIDGGIEPEPEPEPA